MLQHFFEGGGACGALYKGIEGKRMTGGGAWRWGMWVIIQGDGGNMNDGRGGGEEGEGTNNMQCTTHSKQHVKQSCNFLHFFTKFLKKQYPDIVTSRYMHQQSNWGKHKT